MDILFSGEGETVLEMGNIRLSFGQELYTANGRWKKSYYAKHWQSYSSSPGSSQDAGIKSSTLQKQKNGKPSRGNSQAQEKGLKIVTLRGSIRKRPVRSPYKEVKSCHPPPATPLHHNPRTENFTSFSVTQILSRRQLCFQAGYSRSQQMNAPTAIIWREWFCKNHIFKKTLETYSSTNYMELKFQKGRALLWWARNCWPFSSFSFSAGICEFGK